MVVKVTVVRCENVAHREMPLTAENRNGHLKVDATSQDGPWDLRFPMAFASHIHVGQTIEIDVKV